MPAKKRTGAWILPLDPDEVYAHGAGYRFVVCGEGGAKAPSETFSTKARALEARRERQAVIDGRSDVTVSEALDAYEVFMRTEGHEEPCKPASIYQTRRRIETLFPDGEMLLEALTEDHCQAFYDSLRTRAKDSSRARCPVVEGHLPGAEVAGVRCTKCKPYAAAWHRNALGQAKTWLRWCVKPQRYIATNPLEGIKGKGKVKKGKGQLTIDEARDFLVVAHGLAAGEPMDEGAVAALMALEMGLRDNEIIHRVARQIDDKCRRLILVDGKTEESNQTVLVPEDLQPYMARLKAGKFPLQSIWAGYRGKAHTKGWVQDQVARICRLAKVAVVTAHGLRGTYSSLKVAGGWNELADSVRKSLRHRKITTSAAHYIDKGAAQAAGQAAALAVLHDKDGSDGGGGL